MIVVDASVAVLALLNDGEARALLSGGSPLAAPHLVDSEIAQALRAQVRRRRISAAAGGRLLQVWNEIGITRIPVSGLHRRVWQMRDNLMAYDAAYVAVAEDFGADLATADARLAGAPGLRCRTFVVGD